MRLRIAASSGSRTIALTLIAAVVIGALVWLLWLLGKGDGDGVAYHWFTSFDNFLLGAGRLTAFLAGYFALIEVLLLARLPFLERYVGFDRLTIWHRWNGHAVIYLALAHVVFTVWGYAKQDGTNWFSGVLAVAHPAAAARGKLDPLRAAAAACRRSRSTATRPHLPTRGSSPRRSAPRCSCSCSSPRS